MNADMAFLGLLALVALALGLAALGTKIPLVQLVQAIVDHGRTMAVVLLVGAFFTLLTVLATQA